MKLKHYQEKVLEALKGYVTALSEFKGKYEKLFAEEPDLIKGVDFPKKAWKQATGRETYHSKYNGLGEDLPDIYLKVPTGGGKTLLACHSIDLINKTYLQKQNGLVLWIVPSNQIYKQTLMALKDRAHPYRQILDISSGGRTLIKEKTELFSRLDVEECLVIMLLMLPSANRQNKETLRMFRAQGGFMDFFPAEDNYAMQEKMLSVFPNLDCYNTLGLDIGENSIGWANMRQIKTSLGNTLKTLKPIIIIDEGHKTYGELARQTIQGFNPSFVLELSATPPIHSNKLVEITGRELHDEEMIKLDMHLTNKMGMEWKDAMLAAYEKRKELEQKGLEHEGNTGTYIRPICLIQVERTGKDQRGKGPIHAEDVKEYLIKQCSVPEREIAIKSSEKDDIEGMDLLSKECEIRYIITQRALQEGWDCPFAYVLTILTNPQSSTGITQLTGRILRQPYAQKTKVKELDECYIYTFQQNASNLVKSIKKDLENEGLGDIAGRIVTEGSTEATLYKEYNAEYRPGFKKFEGKIFLPKFVVQEKNSWRDVIFEADILASIDWEQINIDEIKTLTLQKRHTEIQSIDLGYNDGSLRNEIDAKNLGLIHGSLEIDLPFFARQLVDIIPNPWVGYKLAKKAIEWLKKRYEAEIVESNFVYIIEELKKVCEKERNQLAEQVFRKKVEEKQLMFFLLEGEGGYLLPKQIKIKGTQLLVREDNSPIQKSLFDNLPEENLNELEKVVAICLDKQEKLLWWYRNMSGQSYSIKNYHIQGWQKHKIYPDFITAKKSETEENDYDSIFVIETKGIHLKNEDTTYKQDVFKLCNEIGAKKPWKELINDFPNKDFEFQVVFGDEWQNKINQLME